MISAFNRRLRSMGRKARPRCAGAIPSVHVACLTKQQWRDLPGDISSGWWLLIAEVLAVLILILLALLTGPRAYCHRLDSGMWGPGALDPETAGARPEWPWAFPNVSRETIDPVVSDIDEDPTFFAPASRRSYELALARDALLAMRKCTIISGAYNSYDLPSFVMHGATAEAQAWAQILNISIWRGNNSLTAARLDDGTWHKVEVHSAYDRDDTWDSHGGYRFYGPLGAGSELLPEACEVSGGPMANDGGQTVWSSDCQGGMLEWTTAYFAVLQDSHSPRQFTNMAPGMLRMDATSTGRTHAPSYKGSVWLQIASQTDETAMCLAQKAPLLLRYLTRSTRSLEPFGKLGF